MYQLHQLCSTPYEYWVVPENCTQTNKQKKMYCGHRKRWQSLDDMTHVCKTSVNGVESRVEVQFIQKQQSIQVAHWSRWHVFRGCVKNFDESSSCGTKRCSVRALTETTRVRRCVVDQGPIFILNTHERILLKLQLGQTRQTLHKTHPNPPKRVPWLYLKTALDTNALEGFEPNS